MTERFCSHCAQLGRRMEFVSINAWVDYYRFDWCGQVWAYDKHSPDAEPRIVVHLVQPER